MSERFSGKIAIVTGGATGIGKAIARRMGKEGALVALFDVNEKALQTTVEEYKKQGIKVKGYQVDISNETQVAEAIALVEKEWSKIDVLVNAPENLPEAIPVSRTKAVSFKSWFQAGETAK